MVRTFKEFKEITHSASFSNSWCDDETHSNGNHQSNFPSKNMKLNKGSRFEHEFGVFRNDTLLFSDSSNDRKPPVMSNVRKRGVFVVS